MKKNKEDKKLQEFDDLELIYDDLKSVAPELELTDIELCYLSDVTLIKLIVDLQYIGIDNKDPKFLLNELKDLRIYGVNE
jgi:hypothetical protein